MGATARAVETESHRQSAGRGYTPVAHPYFEVLPRKTSGLIQYVCIGMILRKTSGVERHKGTPPPEWAEITTKLFCRCAGGTERAVEVALADAVERGLIHREKTGRGYRYKTLPAEWSKCPNYGPKAVPKTDEAEEEADDALEPNVVKMPPAPAIVVKPGKASRPIELAAPVQRVVCENASGEELRFAQHLDGETLVVSIDGNPKCTSGISSPNASRKPEVHFGYSQSPFQSFQQDPRFEPLRDSLDPIWERLFSKTVDPGMLAQLLTRLGDTSVEEYLKVVGTSLAKQAKQGKMPWSGGFFLELADDARKTFERREVRNGIERERLREAERKARIDLLLMALQGQKDPELAELMGESWGEDAKRLLREATADELREAKRRLEDTNS